MPAGRTVEDDLPAIRRTHPRGWKRRRNRCGPRSRPWWRRPRRAVGVEAGVVVCAEIRKTAWHALHRPRFPAGWEAN